MELGVTVARGAMLEGCGEVAVALDELRATRAAPGPARLLLEVAEGGIDRRLVRRLDLAARNRSAEAPEERDGLGSGEGQIEAGDRATTAHGTQPQRLTVRRVVGGEHRCELVGPDLAGEAQLGGGVAHPLPGDLALAGVVVLRAFGDLLQVVHLLAGPELADGKHAGYVRRGGPVPRSIRRMMWCEGGCCWLLGSDLRLWLGGGALLACEPLAARCLLSDLGVLAGLSEGLFSDLLLVVGFGIC